MNLQMNKQTDQQQIDQQQIDQQQTNQQRIINNNDIMHTIIRERHDALVDIEKKTIELSEIYRTLSMLVDDQGSMIDNIEQNIANAKNNTDKGLQEIKQAEHNDRNSCVIL